MSLVCYVLHYRLGALPSFVDGCIPLALIGVVSVVIAGCIGFVGQRLVPCRSHVVDLRAFGTTAGPKARFGLRVLLTYGGGPTTDFAKGVFDIPAAVRATIILDGGYHRLAIEEVEKIFRQSLRARPSGAGGPGPDATWARCPAPPGVKRAACAGLQRVMRSARRLAAVGRNALRWLSGGGALTTLLLKHPAPSSSVILPCLKAAPSSSGVLCKTGPSMSTSASLRTRAAFLS